MRLPDYVILAVQQAGVHVYYADRASQRLWRDMKAADELTRYTGYYWHRVVKGRVVDTDESGPFKSHMAAIKDAYLRLQLRHPKLARK